jgi:hypothetical protein
MNYGSLGADEAEKSAIHDFFIHSQMPILVGDGERFGIVGTSTLFKIAGRSFLVTAAHILDDHPPGTWCCPSHPRKGQIYTIGTAELVRPIDESFDVCVVELKDPNVVAMLDKNWRFLTLNNVWLPDLSADAILVAGYPSVRAPFEDNNLSGKIFIVRQKYRNDVPPEVENSTDPLTKGIDFFIEYENAVNEYTGEDISSVRIGGMSGCSVWAYRKIGWAAHSFWSPEVCLRVIGIQSAYLQNAYLRAKSWGAVLNILAALDKDIQIERDAFVARIFEKLDQSATEAEPPSPGL